jgi:hypothetical protein
MENSIDVLTNTVRAIVDQRASARQGDLTMWPFARKKKREPVRRSLAGLSTWSNVDSDYGVNPLKLDSTLDTGARADWLEKASAQPDHGGGFGGAGSTGDFGSGTSDGYSDSGAGSSGGSSGSD